MNWFYKYAIYFAWVIALSGLFMSLYYGEVMDMEPCRLCWYQRIGMFPLALFLGIATYKNDQTLARYCLPLVVFGGLFALYQALSQIIPALQIGALCGHSAGCTLPGPLPFLSTMGFALIAILILYSFSENYRKS